MLFLDCLAPSWYSYMDCSGNNADAAVREAVAQALKTEGYRVMDPEDIKAV